MLKLPILKETYIDLHDHREQCYVFHRGEGYFLYAQDNRIVLVWQNKKRYGLHQDVPSQNFDLPEGQVALKAWCGANLEKVQRTAEYANKNGISYPQAERLLFPQE